MTPTAPRLACPLASLGAAEVNVGAGGGDDPFGVISPGEILAGEAPPGEVMPDEAC